MRRRAPGTMARLMLVMPLLIATVCASQTAKPAEGFSLERDHLPSASLDGLWRFRQGDDAEFAQPGFDDSAWQMVRSDKSWPEQHLPVALGTQWYRTRVTVPAESPPLSIYMPSIASSYEVYVDGRMVGGAGAMPPHPHPWYLIPMVFPVTSERSTEARAIVIAIRCWKFPGGGILVSGLEPGLQIGPTPLMEEHLRLEVRGLFWNSASNIFLALLEGLAGLAALGLFLFRRSDREYIYYGLYSLLLAANLCAGTWISFHNADVARWVFLVVVLFAGSQLALIAFLFRLLGGKRDWLFRVALVSLLVLLLLAVADFVPWMIDSRWLLMNTALFGAFYLVFVIPYIAWFSTLLARRAMQGRADARLLLPAMLLAALGLPIDGILGICRWAFGWDLSVNWFYRTGQWPFPFSFQNVADALLLIAMLAILIRRFSEGSQRQDNFVRELEAARTVQQVLIPEDLPNIPGLRIESVYKPFGEVGGDFFQILPLVDGGALVVIGDVSGKGMPAAMTVALLVGTLRTLVHYTHKPGEVMAAMNQRMIGRSNGGFTTCLVLYVDRSGRMTMANAGHISPYVNGVELAVETGLPLGLIWTHAYEETVVQLAEHDQLTLMTDGVVEARAESGELLGFDRTRSMSGENARTIAERAQAFGQDDDITVLTLARV